MTGLSRPSELEAFAVELDLSDEKVGN